MVCSASSNSRTWVGAGMGGFQVAPRQQAAGVGQPPGDGPQPPRRTAVVVNTTPASSRNSITVMQL